VLCGAWVTYLFLRIPDSVPNRIPGYAWSMTFLVAIPLCSLFFYIPHKNEDSQATRRRQRIASFAISMVSYPISWLVLSVINAPCIFTAAAAIYTFVALGLMISNLLIRYKASGHAAGVAGPVAAMIYLYGIYAIPLIVLLPLVTWARLAAEGHNFWQTVVGATWSALISIVVLWLFGFPPFLGVFW